MVAISPILNMGIKINFYLFLPGPILDSAGMGAFLGHIFQKKRHFAR